MPPLLWLKVMPVVLRKQVSKKQYTRRLETEILQHAMKPKETNVTMTSGDAKRRYCYPPNAAKLAAKSTTVSK